MATQPLPTDFKDDILASSMDGKRRYHIIDNGDGTVSFEDVTEYTQTGSDFGAKEVNEERGAINELDDRTGPLELLETEVKTSLVDAVNEVDKNADDTASKLGFLVNADNILGNNFGKDFRHVDLSNKYADVNKNSYFSLPEDRSTWSNVPETFPSGQVIGLREVIWRNSSHIMVKITEMFPRQGVEYYSFYNKVAWTAWIERNPSTGDILDSLSSVVANATAKKIAGALAVKEMYTQMNGQKVLWSGSHYMGSDQTINLSGKISEQKQGVVMVFSKYQNGPQDNNWSFHFVPKAIVGYSSRGTGFICNCDGDVIHKYLYISDNVIEGNDKNTTAPNNKLCLRYVIGL